jgi:hypothetical protein
MKAALAEYRAVDDLAATAAPQIRDIAHKKVEELSAKVSP